MDLIRTKLGNSTGIKGLGFPVSWSSNPKSKVQRVYNKLSTLVQPSPCKGWNRKRQVSIGSHFWTTSVLRVRGKFSDSGMGRSRTKETPQAERTARSQTRGVRLPPPPPKPEPATGLPEVDGTVWESWPRELPGWATGQPRAHCSHPHTLPLRLPAQNSYRLFTLILPTWQGGVPGYSARQDIISWEPVLGALSQQEGTHSAKYFKDYPPWLPS